MPRIRPFFRRRPSRRLPAVVTVPALLLAAGCGYGSKAVGSGDPKPVGGKKVDGLDQVKLGCFPNVTHATPLVGLRSGGEIPAQLGGTKVHTQVFDAGPIYAVVLLGAVPSIANGLVAGVDRIGPLHLRAGTVLGATGLRGIRHVLLPAALPGYIAGLKQGWAFSWRSLMAAELISTSPELGVGLGRLLDTGRSYQDMPLVLGAILLILAVGVGIELLVCAPAERRVLRHRGLLR